MRRFPTLLAMIALVAGPSPASAGDQICARIHALAAARPAPADDPKERRWVEFHWGNDPSPETIWSWGCRSSGQQVARETCHWLMDNTSREVPSRLQLRIMSCFGYRFPPTAESDWGNVEGAFLLHDRAGGLMVLEVTRRGLPGREMAMRLTILGPDRYNYDPDKMPPIEPLPPEPD